MGSRLSLLASLLVTSGCPHITHPARVTPGFSAGALAAPTIERYQDPSPPAVGEASGTGHRYDLQLDLRYGWAGRAGRGIQIEAMLPSAVAVYAQLRAEPDLGAGLLVGPNPGAYGMIGNAWLDQDGRGVDLNGGVRLHVLPSLGPGDPVVNGAAFATAAYSSGPVRGGLFLEHNEFARSIKTCDEVCDLEDHVRRRSSAGLFVSRSWD
jgi:hypothetical protein